MVENPVFDFDHFFELSFYAIFEKKAQKTRDICQSKKFWIKNTCNYTFLGLNFRENQQKSPKITKIIKTREKIDTPLIINLE